MYSTFILESKVGHEKKKGKENPKTRNLLQAPNPLIPGVSVHREATGSWVSWFGGSSLWISISQGKSGDRFYTTLPTQGSPFSNGLS